MWIFIMILLIAISGTGITYLANRISKFQFAQKISKGRSPLRFAIGLLLVLFLLAGMWLAMGSVNAVVCMIHLAVFWLLSDFICWMVEKRRKKKSKRYYAGGLAVIISICYLSAGWYAANHVWQTRYNIQTDKMTGNLRVVQFADSHIGTTFDGKEFAKYVDEIQKQKPDIVVITGDYVDDDTTKEDMIDACKALGALKTTYGVYYSFGNHDKGYYDDDFRGYSGDDLIKELEKNNVTVLQDESILLDNRFYIIGRQDMSEEEQRDGKRAVMSQLIELLDKDKFMIVLDHQPRDYESQAGAKVDMVLSGHTHGGQLIPLNFFSKVFKMNDRVYGYEKREKTNFIVTSGISDWALWFKTGCKSEYVIIDVQGTADES